MIFMFSLNNLTSLAETQKVICPIQFQSNSNSSPSWTFLMQYSKAKLKCKGDNASPCFRPFWIEYESNKCLPTRTLLKVWFRHILIRLTSLMAIPNAMRILYNISLLSYRLPWSLQIRNILYHCTPKLWYYLLSYMYFSLPNIVNPM